MLPARACFGVAGAVFAIAVFKKLLTPVASLSDALLIIFIGFRILFACNNFLTGLEILGFDFAFFTHKLWRLDTFRFFFVLHQTLFAHQLDAFSFILIQNLTLFTGWRLLFLFANSDILIGLGSFFFRSQPDAIGTLISSHGRQVQSFLTTVLRQNTTFKELLLVIVHLSARFVWVRAHAVFELEVVVVEAGGHRRAVCDSVWFADVFLLFLGAFGVFISHFGSFKGGISDSG